MSIFQQNGICPALLVGIEEILAPNNPGNIMTPVGGVQSLLDPENRQGVTIQQLGAGDEGHRKQVRIAYKQRQIPDNVRTSKSCDTGTEKPRFEQLTDVTLSNELAIRVNEATVRRLCDNYSALERINGAIVKDSKNNVQPLFAIKEITEEILMDLDALRQKINANFLTAISLNFGKYVGGATFKSYNVIKTADHALVLTGFNLIKQDLAKIGMNGKPIIFGGGNLDLAMMSADLGCCNDAGQDLGMIGKDAGFKFYRDYTDFSSIFGDANAFGAFMPKTAQLVTFNKYVGTFARSIGTMERGTLPDPKLPGIKYDIRVLPNECGEYWDLFVNLDYDFYFAPLNLFKTGDRLAGINGIFRGIANAI